MAKEKFGILCGDSIDESEPKYSLSNDFHNFILKFSINIRKKYSGSMKEIRLCKIGSVELNKALLYEHISSKEHRDFEIYFIMKCMTYCENFDVEIKNDEWREHIISEKHLALEEKRYCEVCHIKYDMHQNSQYHNSKRNDSDRGRYHECSGLLRENKERLEFYSG